MIRKLLRKRWFAVMVSILIVMGFSYCGFLNYNEPTEVGIALNLFTGEMWLQEGGGWYVTPPWVLVARVDTRPMRVAITSSGRGYSAKLVQFDPTYWEEFVQTEGWRYYWWDNRISFNFGYDEEYRGIRDILRGYAYGVRRYRFLRILEEYETQ